MLIRYTYVAINFDCSTVEQTIVQKIAWACCLKYRESPELNGRLLVIRS